MSPEKFANIMFVRKNIDKYSCKSDHHSLNTRNKHKLVGQHYRLNKAHNSFEGLGVRFYNKIPVEILNLPLQKFKSAVKSRLVERGYYTINGFLTDAVPWIITMDDLNAMANRIELRTANMVSVEPVCVDFKKKVIDCYNENEPVSETVKCWDAVGDFTKCVSEAAGARLRARTQREAREHARRTRHVAHAREHALKDLGPTSVLD